MLEPLASLKHSEIFSHFTPTQLELVAALCQEHTYHKGEVIFLEGSSSDELYVIVAGAVEVVTIVADGARLPGKPQEVIISQLSAGQSFGELALVDQGLRSATTRAAQHHTRVLLIPRAHLLELCESYPQLGYRLMRNLATDIAFKLRGSGLRLRQELLSGAHPKSGA